MIDNKKILLHSAEMAEHANGAAQYLGALLGGRNVTKEQTREMVDFLFARTKRNIESALLRPKKKRTQRYTEGNT
jgi:hypothetical protein